MKTTTLIELSACLLALLTACGGESSGNEVGQGGTNPGGTGGTNQAGTGGTNQAGTGGTNQAGTGGTNQAGQGGAEQGGDGGAAGQADNNSSNTKTRDFTLTIENETSESVFVSGLFSPFSLSYNGESLLLSTFCNCDQCNTGDYCMQGDPTPMVVEIPPNDSLEVDTALLRYVLQDVTEATCPELVSWDPVCGEAHALDAGTYLVHVAYDTLAAIEAQGLVATAQTQWGHTVWMEASPGIGVAQLSLAIEDSIVLDASSPVVHTMTISGP